LSVFLENLSKNYSVLSKTTWFYQKPAPLYTGFCGFLLLVFLENRSVLFETYTFANILQNLNSNQSNGADLKNFLY
jgi:hypothetical protein